MNAVTDHGPSTIGGFVAPGFEPVAEEFARNFTERGEFGAAFAAYCRGRLVADLHGGEASPGRPWAEDTICSMFSGTKGLVAGCILKLIEEKLLDPARPVAYYWPEFAANGKERILIRHAVSHRTGIPGIAMPLTADDLADDVRMERTLAAQPMFRDPNAFGCYHALAIGWLCGGLVRRIDGRSIGRFFAEEFAGPLGLDAWIGLPEAEERRVAPIQRPAEHGPWQEELEPEQAADPVCRAVWGNPVLFPEAMPWNSRLYRGAEIPGAGGIANARSMARYYGCLVAGAELDGIRVLKPETLAEGRRELNRFVDPFIGEPMVFGTVFALQNAWGRYGPAADAFGHVGAGGSVHGGWPGLAVGFSYLPNQMRADPEDRRSRPLLEALHDAAAAL